MASCAGHGAVVNEAFALSQVSDLIGDSIIFGGFRDDRFVMLIKR